MKATVDWINDISNGSFKDKRFYEMTSNVNIIKVFNVFEQLNFLIGENTTYYYYPDGNIETRGNIYYSNIGLLKVYINISLGNALGGYIKVEKIRKSENNLPRIQDISDELKPTWDKLFDQKFYYWDNKAFESFNNDISNLKKIVDIYTGNVYKIPDKKLNLVDIHVYHFKKITQAKVSLNNKLNILVGLNNAGKSSFIQGVLLGYQSLYTLFKENKIKYDVYGAIDLSTIPSVRIEKIPFLLGNVTDLFNKNARSSMSRGVKLFRFEFQDDLFIQIGGRLVGEVFSVYIDSCSGSITKNSIKEYLDRPITLIPSFFNVVINEERKSPARYNSLLKTGNYNQLFRNILLDLKEKNKEDNIEESQQPLMDKFYELQQLVEKVFGIKDLDVKFFPEDDEYILATYEVGKSDDKSQERLDISTLGMGTLQFIQVVAQVLLGNPSIILLDEPDAHLHSKLQTEIIGLLKTFSEEYDVKFIIATHSKDIINNVNPKQVLTFNEKSELVSINNLDGFIGVIRNLGATTEEIIGLNIGKRVIIVEGEDDALYIKRLCEKFNIDQEINYNLINFIPIGGRQNVLTNQLDKFLANVDDINDFQKIAIFDRDYRFDEQQKEDADKLSKKGFVVIEWTKKEFENYLIIPHIIADTINSKYPQKRIIQSDDIKRIIDEIYDNDKDNIIYEFEKILELKEKQRIEKNTGEKYEEITLNKDSQIKCRKASRSYVEGQIKSDIICGKEVLKRIRTELILSKTPTKDEFVIDIINQLTNDDLHDDIIKLLTAIKLISS